MTPSSGNSIQTPSSRLVLLATGVCLLALPCFGATLLEVRQTVERNRQLLQNARIAILQGHDSHQAPILQETWQIAGNRYRHEMELRGSDSSTLVRKELHISDGQTLKSAYFSQQRGSVLPRPPDQPDDPAAQPWRLLDIPGTGLGDPLEWLADQNALVQQARPGIVQLHLNTQATPLAVGHATIDHAPFHQRTITLDLNRGGVVLALEDRDAEGNVVLSVENADITRASNGMWYPRRTSLHRYAAGHLVRSVVRQVLVEQGSDNPDDYQMLFPQGFIVWDNIRDMTYTAGGDVRAILADPPEVLRQATTLAKALLPPATMPALSPATVSPPAASTAAPADKPPVRQPVTLAQARQSWQPVVAVAGGITTLSLLGCVLVVRLRFRRTRNQCQ